MNDVQAIVHHLPAHAQLDPREKDAKAYSKHRNDQWILGEEISNMNFIFLLVETLQMLATCPNTPYTNRQMKTLTSLTFRAHRAGEE